MICIEISDLTTATSESLAGADSFLTELKKAETVQIFGGWRGGSSGWKKKDYSYEEKCDYSYKEKCDYSYKEKSDSSYYYKKKRDWSYDSSWKKDC